MFVAASLSHNSNRRSKPYYPQLTRWKAEVPCWWIRGLIRVEISTGYTWRLAPSGRFMLRLLDTAEFLPDFFTVMNIHAGPGSVWKWRGLYMASVNKSANIKKTHSFRLLQHPEVPAGSTGSVSFQIRSIQPTIPMKILKGEVNPFTW